MEIKDKILEEMADVVMGGLIWARFASQLEDLSSISLKAMVSTMIDMIADKENKTSVEIAKEVLETISK